MAVPSIEEAAPLYERLTGSSRSEPEVLPDQGVRVAFVGPVELLEPLGEDTTVGRFLDRRGPALHHLAYRTPDLEAELARLRDLGIRAIDARPRPGARGHRVSFLHPASTGKILVELVERDG